MIGIAICIDIAVIHCGTPPTVSGSVFDPVSPTSTLYDERFTIACLARYNQDGGTGHVDGDDLVVCGEDGTWQFGDILCEGELKRMTKATPLQKQLPHDFVFFSGNLFLRASHPKTHLGENILKIVALSAVYISVMHIHLKHHGCIIHSHSDATLSKQLFKHF